MASSNGPEFVATAILRWTQAAQIETAFIDPGRPWQNGTDESFNGRCRNECLTLAWCRKRAEAKVGIEQLLAGDPASRRGHDVRGFSGRRCRRRRWRGRSAHRPRRR
jgi:transposase InsO family protein